MGGERGRGAAAEEPTDEERAVLEQVRVLLTDIGTANDAQDHGAAEEAGQLRRDASAGLAELLREHPFLAALYPHMAGALGTWRIEGFGWWNYVEDVERRLRYVHLGHIPWDRVVHFTGRATHLEEWITALLGDTHASAAGRIRNCLVRDDAIAQATPLVLNRLLGALRTGMMAPAPAAAVEEMARRIRAAVRLVVGTQRAKGTRAPRVDWSLYHPDHLWPPFESAARDARLWKRWRPTDEQLLGWALLAEQVFEEHDRFMRAR